MKQIFALLISLTLLVSSVPFASATTWDVEATESGVNVSDSNEISDEDNDDNNEESENETNETDDDNENLDDDNNEEDENEESDQGTAMCTMEYSPVCWENGKTYSNSCMAKNAHVDISHTGACKGENMRKSFENQWNTVNSQFNKTPFVFCVDNTELSPDQCKTVRDAFFGKIWMTPMTACRAHGSEESCNKLLRLFKNSKIAIADKNNDGRIDPFETCAYIQGNDEKACKQKFFGNQNMSISFEAFREKQKERMEKLQALKEDEIEEMRKRMGHQMEKRQEKLEDKFEQRMDRFDDNLKQKLQNLRPQFKNQLEHFEEKLAQHDDINEEKQERYLKKKLEILEKLKEREQKIPQAVQNAVEKYNFYGESAEKVKANLENESLSPKEMMAKIENLRKESMQEKFTQGLIPFRDVDDSKDDWYYDFVRRAKKLGLVKGYSDDARQGQFGPANNVLESEALKMAIKAAEIDVQGASEGPWYKNYIEYADKNGFDISMGFDAAEPATREQVIKLIFDAFEVAPNSYTSYGFTDIEDSQYKDEIQTAYELGIISWDNNADTFRPQAPVNRSEVAKILLNAKETFEEDGNDENGTGSTATGDSA